MILRLNKLEYEKLKNKKNRIFHSGESCPSSSDYEKEKAYRLAIQTLHDLQSSGGSLFCGKGLFRLWIERTGNNKRADGKNIYAAVEDALNKIAYYDDKQNRTFDQQYPWR